MAVIIDFLGVSFRVEPSEARTFAETLVRAWLGVEARIVETGRGWSGYAHRLDIEGAGLIAYGGNGDTLHIELSGAGCVQIKDWGLVADVLTEMHGKITRIDLAADDFTGQTYNIAWARAQYEAGGFNPARGQAPKARLWDDLDSGAGKTFYVGARQSGKLARIYEKGREQGDKESEWCRVEVEWRAVHRELPIQMIENPSAYLAGAYPCLEHINALEATPVRTVAYTAAAMLEKAVEHARKQAGRLVHALLAINGGDVAETLAQIHVPELPKRLAGHIRAFLALDESEKTNTTAAAPAFARTATPDEHRLLAEAFRIPRRIWSQELTTWAPRMTDALHYVNDRFNRASVRAALMTPTY